MESPPEVENKDSWRSPLILLFGIGLVGTNLFSYLNYEAQANSGVVDAKEQKLEERRELLDQRDLFVKSELKDLASKEMIFAAKKQAFESDARRLSSEKRSLELSTAAIREDLNAMGKLRGLHLNMHPMNKGRDYAIHITSGVQRADLLEVLPEIQTLKNVSYIDLLNPDVGVHELQKSLQQDSKRIRHLSCQFSPNEDTYPLANFTGLRSLNVSFEGISRARGLLFALEKMGGLESLLIDGRAVRSPGASSVIRLPSLKHIGIKGKEVSKLFFECVRDSPDLQTFVASYSLDTPARLRSLSTFRSLQTVDIAGTQNMSADSFSLFLSGIDIQHLAVPDCELEPGSFATAIASKPDQLFA